MRKNSIHSLLLALAAFGFASCSKESVTSPDEVLTPIRISAVYEGSSTTRVAYAEDDSDITATWQAGDQLYVCYKGNVNTLSLTGGAGTATATFEGTIQGTPTNNSVLICYVRDANNPSAINVDNGEYTYASETLLSQDGTMAGAAKCNVYYGTTTYGTGENISCSFSVNTSMLKFTVIAPDGVGAGATATLSYKTDGTELAKASFTVGTQGLNTIYMTVPAGQYTGAQTVTFKSGSTDGSKTLSSSKATFTAGNIYSRMLAYGSVDLSMLDCAGNNRDSRWTANCYMVHKAGDYKLPLVYGNAIKNGATNRAAYTGISNNNVVMATFLRHDGNAITSPWIKDNGITVASAELLWQDARGLITAVGISGNYLTLTVGKDAATQEGNAVIAAKASDGTIVWSWHIWVTRQTFADATLTTVATGSHDYQVTPVNLGWVATGGDGKQGNNTFYQWGRKDAFKGTGSPSSSNVYNINGITVKGLNTSTSSSATIADNIKNPTTFYVVSQKPNTSTYYNMWDAQQTSNSDNISTVTRKTVYDPSPAGFCVPTGNLYYYMKNGSGANFAWDNTNKGRTLTSVTPNLFFPASGYRLCTSGAEGTIYANANDPFGYCWSATAYSNTYGRYLGFNPNEIDWYTGARANGYPVRAVAEE